LQLRQPIDDTQSHFVTHLHLYHLGREARSDALSVFQFELHLPATLLDEMKQQQRRQTLEFVVSRMLAQIENLRHEKALASVKR
jgi:primosomal protein N''